MSASVVVCKTHRTRCLSVRWGCGRRLTWRGEEMIHFLPSSYSSPPNTQHTHSLTPRESSHIRKPWDVYVCTNCQILLPADAAFSLSLSVCLLLLPHPFSPGNYTHCIGLDGGCCGEGRKEDDGQDATVYKPDALSLYLVLSLSLSLSLSPRLHSVCDRMW